MLRTIVCEAWVIFGVISIAFSVFGIQLLSRKDNTYKNRKKTTGSASIIIGIASVIAIGITYSSSSQMVDVVGLSIENATQTLKESGLLVNTNGTAYDKGQKVTSQSIKDGIYVKKKTTIFLTLEKPEIHTLEDINDKDSTNSVDSSDNIVGTNSTSNQPIVNDETTPNESIDNQQYSIYSDTGLPFNGYIYRSYDVTSFVGYNADTNENIWDIDLIDYRNANICDVSLSFSNYDVTGYTMSIQMVGYPNSGYGLIYKFVDEARLYITPGTYMIDVHKEVGENQFVSEYIGYVTINTDGYFNVELEKI